MLHRLRDPHQPLLGRIVRSEDVRLGRRTGAGRRDNDDVRDAGSGSRIDRRNALPGPRARRYVGRRNDQEPVKTCISAGERFGLIVVAEPSGHGPGDRFRSPRDADDLLSVRAFDERLKRCLPELAARAADSNFHVRAFRTDSDGAVCRRASAYVSEGITCSSTSRSPAVQIGSKSSRQMRQRPSYPRITRFS